MTDARALLELLYEVSRELASNLDLHQVLERLLLLSTTHVGAERGMILVIDEQQDAVDAAMVYEGRLLPYTVQQARSTLERGLAGWVRRTRQAVLVPDTSLDERWVRRPDDDAQRSGAKSSLCVPLNAHDQLVGVLTLVHDTPGFFDHDHLALLQNIADQAGAAVNNARLYESLQAAHRRYQDLFEDSIDPIFVTTPDGIIQEVNHQAERISKRAAPALRGLNLWMMQEKNNGIAQRSVEGISANASIHFETTFFPFNAAPLPVELYVRKAAMAGHPVLQWILRDLSERKQLDELRDDLTAMIYHDLRAPLGNIISSLDMIRTLPACANEDVTQEVLSIALRSSERMQRLISSLLDINRLESGQSPLQRSPVSPISLMHEAAETVGANLHTRRQKLTIDASGALPPLWIDEDMIRRVLINLLENAAKFTPAEGAIYLVGELISPQWVRFSVRDSGPGIPEAAQAEIFNKFTRLNIEHAPKGLGLGLAFCKLAVQAHGGTIGVESNFGDGSCFYFTVPAVE